MTWLTFSIALAVGYILYYGSNILWDLSRRPKSQPRARNVLRFTENPQPVVIGDDPGPDHDPEQPDHPAPESTAIIPLQAPDEPDIPPAGSSGDRHHHPKQEVTPFEEEEPFIAVETVEAVISPTGGVPVRALVELFRQQAVVQAAAIPFH